MIKEWKVKQLTKLVETSFKTWDVTFNGQMVGAVERNFSRKLYRAISSEGRFIGSTGSKSEAKMFVVQEYLGKDNIIWKGEAQ